MEESKKELFQKVTLSQFMKIVKMSMDLNIIFLFEKLMNGIDLPSISSDVRIAGWLQTLYKKSWVDADYKPTLLGIELYNTIFTEESAQTIVKNKKKEAATKFDEWWAIFPPTDKFEYKGKVFSGTRGLRVSKDTCRELFEKWVKRGDYKAEQIIEATKVDVETRKQASLKEGRNKLTFLQNSATYLRNASFDPYVNTTFTEEVVTNLNNTVDV